MTFRSKILAVLLLVGAVPAAAVGWLSFRTSRAEIGRVVGGLQGRNAAEVARACEELVAHGVESLRLSASYLPFEQLRPDELAAVLAIPYRQVASVSIVALLDERGDAVVPPVFERTPGAQPGLTGREPVGEKDLERFAGRIPLEAALAAGVAVGPPYRGPPGRPPRVAVALRVDGSPRRALAAELVLTDIQNRLDESAGAGELAFLVDSAGALLGHSDRDATLSAPEVDLARRGLAANHLLAEPVVRAGQDWFAAFAPVGHLGWGVVVAQPTEVAFRAAHRVRQVTLAWAGLALGLAVVLGVVVARSLSRPIAALSEVAAAVTGGAYDRRAPVESGDEIGQFARAFNQMTDEVQRRDAEIRGWNQELQKRVDERSAELKAAQDQILRARRLAALGSLGAGVAHELNNPLTSVIGIATLVRRDLGDASPHAGSLSQLIDQARRAARIATELRQLTDQERESAGRRFALAKPVRAALDLCAERIREGGVTTTLDVALDLPDVQGNPLQIQQLVVHLVQNALNAMPSGGELRIGLGAVAREALRLTVADTGKGVPEALRERIFDPFFSTKDRPDQLGLGLSICHTIVEAHHGKIAFESAEGRGTTFTVILPAAAEAAHLI